MSELPKKHRLGILTSGGDAPGMNAALRAAVRTALEEGIDVVAIREGYRVVGLRRGAGVGMVLTKRNGFEFGGVVCD